MSERPQRSTSQALRYVDRQLSSMRRQRKVVMSLRWQVLMLLLVVLLLTIGLVALAVLGLTRENLEGEHLKTSQALVRLLAGQLDQLIPPGEQPLREVDKASLELVVGHAVAHPDVAQIVLLGRGQGVLLEQPKGQQGRWPLKLSEKVYASGELSYEMLQGRERLLWIVAPLVNSPELQVMTQINMRRVDDHVRTTQDLLLLYLGLDALLMLVVGYLALTRLVLSPLHEIVTTVRLVTGGDPEERVKISSANEIGLLATEFNLMVDQLQRQRRELERKVSQLERANQELAVAQRSLVRSEKLATTGQLAAGVAHEVGNPLAAALGYLELLEDGDLEPDVVQDLLTRTSDATRRIDRTIRDLLDFSRVERGSIMPHDLNQIVKVSLDLVKVQPRFRGVTLRVKIAEGLPLVHVNDGKMQQVFVNLLLNARDALHDDGEIEISGAHEGGWVVVTLSDTGGGISPADLSQVFEPFFTTKEPGKGTGLGLAICQSIVASFGGNIQVDSKLGEGTRVMIKLLANARRGGV